MSEPYIGLFNGWDDQTEETTFVRQHLTGLSGPVLDLGCGPGHWTAYLHSFGTEATGIDMVPEFIKHAQATYPGPKFQLGQMTTLDVPDHSVAGILSWYSTIHLSPPEVDRVLAVFRQLLRPSGMLVIGFFGSDDDVSSFDHKVATAYRWPIDIFSKHLTDAGFTEVQRLQHQLPERPDRKFAAIAAIAS
jgi:SAM-dependent methyltransferase